MLLPNRHGSSNEYRYGFQGQEKDDEIKGEGNSLNFKFRMHDPRVGRFFASDPLMHRFPWYSPYQFSGNSPILFAEFEGLERYYAGDGSLIGQWGINPLPLMVVSDKTVSDRMKENNNDYNDRSLRDCFSTKAKPLDISEGVHNKSINAVKLGASIYKTLADETQDPTLKAAYLEANDLLMDFAVDNPPYLRIYENTDPMSQLINKDNRIIKEVASDFNDKIGNAPVEFIFDGSDTFDGSFEFSPDDSIGEKGLVEGLKETVYEHYDGLTNNPINIVVGGASYQVSKVVGNNGQIQGFNITLSNISGKNSLLLHQATNIPDISSQRVPLSNKAQQFNLYISIESFNKIRENVSKE